MEYFVHPTAVVDEGAVIGRGSSIWHFCHVMGGASIGEDCSFGQNCFVAATVITGNNVKVQNNVSLYDGVQCGDDVFIGPGAVFTNVLNPRAAVNRKGEYKPTRLQKGVTVGANATIICGISIGEYAFIGAGAVVTRDVPAYALVTGNPARQAGWRSAHGEKLHFNSDGFASCPQTNEAYELKDGEVSKTSAY